MLMTKLTNELVLLQTKEYAVSPRVIKFKFSTKKSTPKKTLSILSYKLVMDKKTLSKWNIIF